MNKVKGYNYFRYMSWKKCAEKGDLYYIVAISFIGGGHQSARRKPQICRKSLKNFIT